MLILSKEQCTVMLIDSVKVTQKADDKSRGTLGSTIHQPTGNLIMKINSLTV